MRRFLAILALVLVPSWVVADSYNPPPIGGISGLGDGVATFLGTPSSANLATALTDETGTGLAVFATSPLLTAVRYGLGSSSATAIQPTGNATTGIYFPNANQMQLAGNNLGGLLVNGSGNVLFNGAGHIFGFGAAFSSSNPGMTFSGTTLQIRLGDNSADAPVAALNVTASGAIINTGITTDAAHTDSSVCQDTTTHQFYAGSGAAGICLGTSSARFKLNIQPQADGLAEVLKLKPVNFRYKHGYGDSGEREQYGFIAEDVAKVMPKLVGLDTKGAPLNLDYMALVPVLVKAVQEQQREIEALRRRLPGG